MRIILNENLLGPSIYNVAWEVYLFIVQGNRLDTSLEDILVLASLGSLDGLGALAILDSRRRRHVDSGGARRSHARSIEKLEIVGEILPDLQFVVVLVSLVETDTGTRSVDEFLHGVRRRREFAGFVVLLLRTIRAKDFVTLVADAVRTLDTFELLINILADVAFGAAVDRKVVSHDEANVIWENRRIAEARTVVQGSAGDKLDGEASLGVIVVGVDNLEWVVGVDRW